MGVCPIFLRQPVTLSLKDPNTGRFLNNSKKNLTLMNKVLPWNWCIWDKFSESANINNNYLTLF